jgi:hypothetical protein
MSKLRFNFPVFSVVVAAREIDNDLIILWVSVLRKHLLYLCFHDAETVLAAFIKTLYISQVAVLLKQLLLLPPDNPPPPRRLPRFLLF